MQSKSKRMAEASIQGRMAATLSAIGSVGETIRLEGRWIGPLSVLKDLELTPGRERRVLLAYVGPEDTPESPVDAPWMPEGYVTAVVRLPDLVRSEAAVEELRTRLRSVLTKHALGLAYAEVLPCNRLPEHPWATAVLDLIGELGKTTGDALRKYRQDPQEFLSAWNRDELRCLREMVKVHAPPLLQAECRALLAPVMRVVCYNPVTGQVQVADFARPKATGPDPVEMVLTEEDVTLFPGVAGEDACMVISRLLGKELRADRLRRVTDHWSVFSPSYGNLHHPYLAAFDEIYKKQHDLNKMLRQAPPRLGGDIEAAQYEAWERERLATIREAIGAGAFKESDATKRWLQPVRVLGLVLAHPSPDPAERADGGGTAAVAALDAGPEKESVKFIIEKTTEFDGDPIGRLLKAHRLTPEQARPLWTSSRPLGAYLKDKPIAEA